MSPLSNPFFQPERTGHAGLLGGGKERFQRTVLQRIVLQHGQNRRRTDTVVSPQRRTVGRHPVAVDVGADRVFQEVELLVVVLLRHHVEMRLQDHPPHGSPCPSRRVCARRRCAPHPRGTPTPASGPHPARSGGSSPHGTTDAESASSPRSASTRVRVSKRLNRYS